jgi:hypothetical protein
VTITGTTFAQLWATQVDVAVRIDFDEDTSLLTIPSLNLLWVPIRGTLLGADGIALTFSTAPATLGLMTVVAPPKSSSVDCASPQD